MEKTWKPPESVMIGRRQAMNSCRPPISATWSSPGVMNRWKVLPSTIGKPRSATSDGLEPLDRAARGQRDERRRRDVAVGGMDEARAGAPVAGLDRRRSVAPAH